MTQGTHVVNQPAFKVSREFDIWACVKRVWTTECGHGMCLHPFLLSHSTPLISSRCWRITANCLTPFLTPHIGARTIVLCVTTPSQSRIGEVSTAQCNQDSLMTSEATCATLIHWKYHLIDCSQHAKSLLHKIHFFCPLCYFLYPTSPDHLPVWWSSRHSWRPARALVQKTEK